MSSKPMRMIGCDVTGQCCARFNTSAIILTTKELSLSRVHALSHNFDVSSLNTIVASKFRYNHHLYIQDGRYLFAQQMTPTREDVH